MSRVRKLYARRLRELLQAMGCPAADRAADRILTRATREGRDEAVSLSHTATLWERRLRDRLGRRSQATPPHLVGSARAAKDSPRFLCDAGLGGLARWLRAAGCETYWIPGISDADLLSEARRRGAVILTTDSLLMERRLLRDGTLPALWLSPSFTVEEQLVLVFREFQLEPRPSLCMRCGGNLRPAEKDAIRERIPPRTARWLDDYFLCTDCGRLYWHGTHWLRIQTTLDRVARSARGSE